MKADEEQQFKTGTSSFLFPKILELSGVGCQSLAEKWDKVLQNTHINLNRFMSNRSEYVIRTRRGYIHQIKY